LIGAARPALLENAKRLRILLERSNRMLRPLADPLLTDYGAHEWLSRSREEAYSDWLKWVLRAVKEPHQLLRVLDIDDLVVEDTLRGIPLDWAREVFTAEGHPGHTGRIDLRMVVPGKVLIQVELKMASADYSDVEKNVGYTASAKTYGVPKRHRHWRLLATEGDLPVYPGGYRLVTWRHLAVQLRIVAAQMVKNREVLAASKVLGFVGAVEQNLINFSSSVAELAFSRNPMPLSAGLIDHLECSLNGKDQDAKSKDRVR
jgi:hypothetical protein